MERYIALLRGVNIGGKNKIVMSELKADFIELGYTAVCTYLNSGNVMFSSAIQNRSDLSGTIKSMIKQRYQLDIPIFIITQNELEDILKNAPEWWGSHNKERYDNLIFMLPSLSYDELYNALGKPKADYESIYNYKNVVFWSFNRKEYQKTNWWSKTANSNIRNSITIRTANTIRKIAKM